MLEQYVTFRRIFDEKHKAGEILPQERAVSIYDIPFSKHNEKTKAR